MFLDLNGFKKINDDFGYDAGDYVLKSTASRLRNSLNEKDSLIHLGDDEFLIFATIENDNSEKDIINIIQRRIKETINQAILLREKS